MAAIDKVSNPLLDSLKAEISKLVWKAFEDIKDDSIPIHISIFHVPISIDVKISNLQSIIEKLVGPEVIDSSLPDPTASAPTS